VGYVYLIWQENTSFYKIGCTNNINKRLSMLQTSHSSKLHLLGTIETEEHVRKEGYLHNKYKNHHIKGEWFNFHPLFLREVLTDFTIVDKDVSDTPLYWLVTNLVSMGIKSEKEKRLLLEEILENEKTRQTT
jgi:hypothetical protein